MNRSSSCASWARYSARATDGLPPRQSRPSGHQPDRAKRLLAKGGLETAESFRELVIGVMSEAAKKGEDWAVATRDPS
jgi:hypothetical protein